VTALLFTSGTITGRSGDEATDYSVKGGNYDPWSDTNDDGVIDMKDIYAEIRAFMAKGTPITKAAIEYDSGWVDITDKAGEKVTIVHNLNITNWNTENIIVEITGKTTLDPHALLYLLRNLGLTGFTPGWSKTYGGTSSDVANSLVQTVDGGYAIAGYGFANLVKTDMNGNPQWNKTYLGFASSVVQTSDGGYALAGRTPSFGAGARDFWLVKTDSAGASPKFGLAWIDSTADSITLYRGATDPYWNYVRVRIWKIKETP